MTKIRAKKSQSNCLMRHREVGCAVTYACAGVHIMRVLMICTPHQILIDQMKKNEIGGACSTYG